MGREGKQRKEERRRMREGQGLMIDRVEGEDFFKDIKEEGDVDVFLWV